MTECVLPGAALPSGWHPLSHLALGQSGIPGVQHAASREQRDSPGSALHTSMLTRPRARATLGGGVVLGTEVGVAFGSSADSWC